MALKFSQRFSKITFVQMTSAWD